MIQKNFWKYFFNTIKESKWLLLRYFIVGLYLIVVGIIANRLNINDLTYYNSMITICFFGEMMAFGFSEGFGIYINQKIGDLDKAKKYAKMGLYFTFSLVFIVAIIFAIFPSFILKTILNLDFEVNLTFYYIMLVAMVIMSIFSYVNLLLKKVGEFKQQLVTTIVQAVMLVVGFVLILLIDKLMLIPIGIIYILVHIACIVSGDMLLRKNKEFKISLFKFERLHLTKNELKVIIARALSEIVWEVGYMFISLFILKVDVISYNQYCYFENALDIINGLFFAFVSVVSIKICRCIGEDKKEEAKMHGKYSLISTVVIWAFYAIVTMLIFIPLRYGMNVELQETALVSVVLYLVVALFRFVEWNLGTYILGQSEFYVKMGLILEIIFMCYWIVLYSVANYIPAIVYLIYGFIAFENIIKIVISLFVLKNPKWLEKCE